jgi:rhomboid protease GluP
VLPHELRFLEVVQALVAERVGGRLVALGTTGAALAMPDKSFAVVVSVDHGAPAELAEHWRTLVEDNPRQNLKLVLVGGGPELRELMIAAQPRVMLRRVVQVFALGDDNRAWAGPRSSLRSPLGRVLMALGEHEPGPVDRAALEALIVEPSAEERAHAEEQRGFAQKLRATPRATQLLIASYGVAFGLEMLWGGAESMPTLVRMGANTSHSLWSEPWDLLASVWLHAGLLHVLANAYAMWLLGGFLEKVIGWQRLVILYVLAGIGGSIASAAMGSGLFSVGASGAICGALGAAAALSLRPAGLIPPSVLPVVRRNAMVNLLLSIAVSFVPQVDAMAHLGGGLVGAALVFSGVLTRGLERDAPARANRPTTAAALAGIALLVAAFVTALVHGRPWELAALDRTVERHIDDVHVTIPVALGAGEVVPSENGRSVLFGDLLDDPIAIAITIEPHGLDLSDPDERAEIFENERRRGSPLPDEGMIAVGEQMLDPRGDMPAFRQHYRLPNGLQVILWYQVRPAYSVTMQAWWWPEYEGAEALGEQAFASLRVD